MSSPFVAFSLIFAFLIPILFANAIKNIVEKKPYELQIFLVSIGFTFIIFTLCVYTY